WPAFGASLSSNSHKAGASRRSMHRAHFSIFISYATLYRYKLSGIKILGLFKKNKTLILVLITGFWGLFSCKKSNTVSPENDYLNTTTGSQWIFHLSDTTNGQGIDTTLIITSSPNDTIINGRRYHIYIDSIPHLSSTIEEYYANEGNNIYQWVTLAFPTATPNITPISFAQLNLRTDLPVGGMWFQYDTTRAYDDFGLDTTIIITIANRIVEKDLIITVNDITYNDITHVSTAMSSPFFQPGQFKDSTESYYSKKYGLVES